MAETVAANYSQAGQQNMLRPDPSQELHQQPGQLEHLLGERLPATDVLTAEWASQHFLRGLAEIVPDNSDQRRVVSRGQETTMDMRSPIAQDGPHSLIGAVTQGCADKALGVWLIHEEGTEPVVILAHPDFRPSTDRVYSGSGPARRVSGGVPVSRYREAPTVTGRAKDLNNPVLGSMPDTVSRRQSEYYVDDDGIVHIRNIGSNDIAVLRGPSRVAIVDQRSQTKPSGKGVEHTSEGDTSHQGEASGQLSDTWYAEQINRIADPKEREKAEQWLAKKAEVEEGMAAFRKRQEGYLEDAIRSGVISTEEQLAERRAFIERRVAQGIQGDHLYSPANESRYQGWQTYHLTVAPNGDVIIDYDKPAELDFHPSGRPVTPGRYILHKNPFVVR